MNAPAIEGDVDAAEPSVWQPIAETERCRAIDVIRGAALLGVLLVNLHSNFRVSLPEDLLGLPPGEGWANQAADFMLVVLIQFKAFALFSLLFGVGLAVFDERAAARRVRAAPFLSRRLLVLLALGLCHLLLIWNGDILTLYAVCGLILLPLRRLPAPALALVGAAFLGLPYVVAWGPGIPAGDALRDLAREAARTYTVGTVADVVRFHWRETQVLIVPLLVGVLPRTCGLMALGAAAWKADVFRRPDEHRRLLWGTALVGSLVGVTATFMSTFAISTPVPAAVLNAASSVPLALGYAAALLLALRVPAISRALSPLAAAGQMALTNYLAQSIVLSLLFYGYGLGLYGRLGSARAAGVGLLLYVAQVFLSSIWLSHYRFGPVEWVWRSLTYGALQPMRPSASKR